MDFIPSHPILVKVGDCVGLYYPHNENSGTEKPANVDTEKNHNQS